MSDKEGTPIDGEISFITFKELVEQITGSSFEEVYGDWIDKGVSNEQGNVE